MQRSFCCSSLGVRSVLPKARWLALRSGVEPFYLRPLLSPRLPDVVTHLQLVPQAVMSSERGGQTQDISAEIPPASLRIRARVARETYSLLAAPVTSASPSASRRILPGWGGLNIRFIRSSHLCMRWVMRSQFFSRATKYVPSRQPFPHSRRTPLALCLCLLARVQSRAL